MLRACFVELFNILFYNEGECEEVIWNKYNYEKI